MAVQASVGTAVTTARQLGLYEQVLMRRRVPPPRPVMQLCAGCRAKEARYGFGEGEAPVERPRTLCFECFRMEIDYRQRLTVQLARGWNAEQRRLPLAERLEELTTRRRRAQIAARKAVAEAGT
jgi:hypothetical protein